MESMDKLLREIDILRNTLDSLIEIKGNLLDPEVIHTSRLLDTALNKYNRRRTDEETPFLTINYL